MLQTILVTTDCRELRRVILTINVWSLTSFVFVRKISIFDRELLSVHKIWYLDGTVFSFQLPEDGVNNHRNT
jgi:hypothetical protein